MADVTPLKPGEYIDLDSGVRVVRSDDGEDFMLQQSQERTHHVELPQEGVAALARLAGFSLEEDL